MATDDEFKQHLFDVTGLLYCDSCYKYKGSMTRFDQLTFSTPVILVSVGLIKADTYMTEPSQNHIPIKPFDVHIFEIEAEAWVVSVLGSLVTV